MLTLPIAWLKTTIKRYCMPYTLGLLFYFIFLSVVTERIIELIKLLIPGIQWSNQRYWKIFIAVIAVAVAFTISYNLNFSRFFVFTFIGPEDRIIFSAIDALVATGGSKLWHDMLVKSKLS